MPKKTITLVLTLMAAVVLLFGDFLPQPIRGISISTRNSLNNFVAGFFPSWRPQTKPYDRTEKELEQQQKQQQQ